MFRGTIEFVGKTMSDVNAAVEEALARIEGDNVTGFDSNTDGAFYFDVQEVPDGEVAVRDALHSYRSERPAVQSWIQDTTVGYVVTDSTDHDRPILDLGLAGTYEAAENLITKLYKEKNYDPDDLTVSSTFVVAGGDVGGDIQAGEAFNIRYTHATLPGRVVDVYFYACFDVQKTVDTGAVFVQAQTRYTICTDMSDPGGTEIWSSTSYTMVEDCTTVDGAIVSAYDAAKEFTAEDIHWDGEATKN